MQCIDPRDKFYGLRGIAKSGSKLPVDYSKSKTDILFDVLSMYVPSCIPGALSTSFNADTIGTALDLCLVSDLPLPELLDFLNTHPTLNLFLWLRHRVTTKSLKLQNLGWVTSSSNYIGEISQRNAKLSQNLDTRVEYHIYEVFRIRKSVYRRYFFEIAFLDTEAYSRPIGYRSSVSTTIASENRHSRSKSQMPPKILCGNIQVCRAINPIRPKSPSANVPAALLVHISAAAYLALVCNYSGDLDSLDSLIEFTERNKSDDCANLVCNCSAAAQIMVEGEGRDSKYSWDQGSQNDPCQHRTTSRL